MSLFVLLQLTRYFVLNILIWLEQDEREPGISVLFLNVLLTVREFFY